MTFYLCDSSGGLSGRLPSLQVMEVGVAQGHEADAPDAISGTGRLSFLRHLFGIMVCLYITLHTHFYLMHSPTAPK